MQTYTIDFFTFFYFLRIWDEINSPLPMTSSKQKIILQMIVSVLSATELATPRASVQAKEELPVETVLQGKFSFNQSL